MTAMLESAHENLANKANSIMSKKKFNAQLLFFEQFLAGNSGHFIDVKLKQLYEQQALSCQCVWCSRVHPSCCRGELLLSMPCPASVSGVLEFTLHVRPCPASVSGVLEFTLHVVEGNCYSAGPVLPVCLVF